MDPHPEPPPLRLPAILSLLAALVAALVAAPTPLAAGEPVGRPGAGTAPCVPDAITLCLHDGRFEARVTWQDFQGGSGDGHGGAMSSATGNFWFFHDSNLELAVKVLDGTPVNGHWWLFYGSLTNVGFTLTVRDTATGVERRFVNPPRTFASRGDTRAFPAAGPSSGTRPPAAAPAMPAAAAAAPGRAGAWSPLGPDGGPVWTVLVAAGDPDVLYAGSGASGVFRSSDGGDSWAPLPASPASAFAHVLEMDEAPDGTIYAVHFDGSIHRSPDRGDTWIGIPAPPAELYASSLAADPDAPGVLYAGSFEGLFRSADGGDSWQPVESFPRRPGGPAPASLGVDDLSFDAAGGTLWAATIAGVYRSSDGAATWHAASGGLSGDALRVEALAAVPGIAGRLYAATDAGIYETTDGGGSWTARGPSPLIVVHTLTVDPAAPRHLWATAVERLQESRDGGATWSPVAALPDPVYGVTADPRGNGTVYAGSERGVHRSRDGGVSWQLAVGGLSARHVTGLYAHPETRDLVLAVADGTIFRSVDGGATWTAVLEDDVRHLAGSEAAPDMVWAAGEHRIHRSFDRGATWQPLGGFEPHLFDLWVDPEAPDVAFTAGTIPLPFGTDPTWVYRSTDGGASWEVVWFGGDVTVLDLAIGPSRPGQPGAVLFSSQLGLERSFDGGASFEPAAGAGLSPTDLVAELTADPLEAGRFLGAVVGKGLWETLDSGDSWRPLGTGLPAASTPRLLFHPGLEVFLYAATDGQGVFRSVNRGASWHPIGGEGPFDRPTGPLALGLTGDPLRLYAATDRGVRSASPNATAACAHGPENLCLRRSRFRVEVVWRDFQGGSGAGRSRALNDETGAFWFFDPANVELFVKILDGRPVNGRFWVFYGSLSNVAFTITVTDTTTGEQRIYENPERTFASRGDTAAF